VVNVHFSNNDKSAKLHLKETLVWCKENNLKPVIAGYFNIKIVEDLIKIAGKDYEISYHIKPYKSFMPTKFSHNSEPITLDYILSSKERFVMETVECIEKDSSSDHKLIIAMLSII